MEKRTYNSIDILKIILALFVVVIHSGIDKTVLAPVLRIAVPLFFIISSYFFFTKNAKLQTNKEKNTAFLKTIKRNLFLYLFWAIIQLPIVIFMRGYHHDFIFDGVLNVLKDIVIGGAFTGAWYLVALIIGILFVYLMSKKIPSIYLVLLSLPIYVFCCLTTNYINLFEADSLVIKINNGYYSLIGQNVCNSFPIALFWVSLGKLLADRKNDVKNGVLISCGALFSVMIALECFFIVKNDWRVLDDCFFMLMFLCPVIFLLVKKIKITVTTKLRIRELSVLIYVTHGCCGRIVGYALKYLFGEFYGINIVKAVISVIIIACFSQLLIYLREKYNIKFLKYAY